MVGEVEERLVGLAEGRLLVPEGVVVGVEVEVALEDEAPPGGLHDAALEADPVLEDHVAVEEVGPGGHQHLAALGGAVGGVEGGGVVRRPVAAGAVVAHVHLGDHVAQEGRGHVLHRDVVDAQHGAVRAGHVEAEMGRGDRAAPGQVHAGAVRGGDDGRDLHHLAVAGDRPGRAGGDLAGDEAAARALRVARDADRGEGARHALHAGGDAQVEAGQEGRLDHAAHLLGGRGLDDLQAAGEVLVGGHEGPAPRAGIGVRARRAVAARPVRQPRREGRGHQRQPLGDGHVHAGIPCACDGRRVPVGG